MSRSGSKESEGEDVLGSGGKIGVRVVSVKTTMQCLDWERRKERIREKRKKM